MSKIDTIDEDVTGELIPVEDDDYEIIDNEAGATSLLERIAARKHKIAKLHELYLARVQPLRDKIEQAEQWLNDEEAKLLREVTYLAAPLEQFMRAINASNPKIKSLNLPTGKLKLRKSQDKVIIAEEFNPTKDDMDKPGVIEKISYSVDRKAVKKYIEETGEILDYATIEKGETKFDYEVL